MSNSKNNHKYDQIKILLNYVIISSNFLLFTFKQFRDHRIILEHISNLYVYLIDIEFSMVWQILYNAW